MKHITIMLSLLVLVGISSCSSIRLADSKLRRIEEPFSGNKYFSDKKHFRSTGEGKALELTVAKRIADTNARQSLASQLQVTVRSVAEQYLQNRSISTDLETTSKYEEITRTVISETLNGVEVFDRASYQNKRGEYVHYVAMQMSTSALEDDLTQAIQSDDKLRQDFDLEQFREVFQEELDQFEKERQQ